MHECGDYRIADMLSATAGAGGSAIEHPAKSGCPVGSHTVAHCRNRTNLSSPYHWTDAGRSDWETSRETRLPHRVATGRGRIPMRLHGHLFERVRLLDMLPVRLGSVGTRQSFVQGSPDAP